MVGEVEGWEAIQRSGAVVLPAAVYASTRAGAWVVLHGVR